MKEEILSKQIGGKNCYIYDCGSSDVLLIQPVDDHDLEVLDSEVAEISRIAGIGFTLAAFKVDDWNADLSPWEAPPVFGSEGFAGGAEETLKYVTEQLIPDLTGGKDGLTVSKSVPRIFIGGYSLAGFFALWAAYQTDTFKGVAAASPSVWFPGWIEYAGSRSIETDKVYLSLGDKEEKARNPVMRTVGDNIRKQYELLKEDPACGKCTLEMNQGNHFKEPDLRTARAFVWVMQTF